MRLWRGGERCGPPRLLRLTVSCIGQVYSLVEFFYMAWISENPLPPFAQCRGDALGPPCFRREVKECLPPSFGIRPPRPRLHSTPAKTVKFVNYQLAI